MNEPTKPKRRWFVLTPDRLMVALVVGVVLLFLSEQFRWFSFNDHKGWTVLITVATVAAVLSLTLCWFLISLVFRRRFQYSIRFVMLLALVLAMVCGWLMTELHRANRQRDAVDAAQKAGCGYFYDDNVSASGDVERTTGPKPAAPFWYEWLGDDFFHDVVAVQPRTDEALSVWKDLTSLRIILANDSEVTDGGLTAIEQFKQLERLNLQDAGKVTDAGLEHLRGLSQLKTLMLRRTRVTDAGMVNLKDLNQLQILDLGMTQVSDAGLSHLAGLTELRQLLFWGNKITDAGLVHMRGMTRLQRLELGGAAITDAGLETIGQFSDLQAIYLRGSRLTDAGLRRIGALSRLEELDLFNTRVTDLGLDNLTGLSRLRLLYLGETQVTDKGVARLQQALPACKIQR
jgi:internalin A